MARHMDHKSILRNEEGVVLAVTLMLIAVLAILGTSASMTVTTDLKIAGNYREGQKALYDAEAGMAQAISYLRTNTITYPTTSGSPTTVTITVPSGFSFNSSVVIYYVSANNYRFQMTGTGANNASKTLETTFTRASTIPAGADGSLAMYGTGSTVELKSGGGGGANVDGHNFPVPDTFNCTGSACRTTGSDTGISPGLFTTATPTITGDTSHIDGSPARKVGGTTLHTNAEWSDFVDYIIDNNLYVAATPGGSLGTRTAPQITRIVNGGGYESSIEGSTAGAGILIIDNGGEFTLTGTAHFEGLIILRGSGTLHGSGTASVYGSVITIDHTSKTVDLNGTVDLLYSSAALANLSNISSLTRVSLTSWKAT